LLVELMQEELEYDTYFAFVTCEEVGTDGAKQVAFNLRPDIAIAIEATTAGDVLGAPKSQYACELRKGAVISHIDGSTIYDKKLVEYALATAQENNIKCQLKNVIAGGNDASAYQRTAAGARVLAVSAPTRYIHSASNVVCKDDLFEIKKLVLALLQKGF